IGFGLACFEVFRNIDAYLGGQKNAIMLLLLLMSGLATVCIAFIYVNAKTSIQELRRPFLSSSDELGPEPPLMPLQADGTDVVAVDKQGEAFFVGLEFKDNELAKHALRVYRTERRGYY